MMAAEGNLPPTTTGASPRNWESPTSPGPESPKMHTTGVEETATMADTADTAYTAEAVELEQLEQLEEELEEFDELEDMEDMEEIDNRGEMGSMLDALVEDTPDLLEMCENLSAKTISQMPEQHLLHLLPLLLHLVDVNTNPRAFSKLNALQTRIQTSRRVKLRFLLLRGHPSFKSLASSLRYSSRAYTAPVFSTAASTSHIDLHAVIPKKQRAMTIIVDMVGKLQRTIPFHKYPHSLASAGKNTFPLTPAMRMRIYCNRHAKRGLFPQYNFLRHNADKENWPTIGVTTLRAAGRTTRQ